MEEVKKIGKYRIVREISRSSVASVYEGYQASLDRQVLIKRLHPELTGDQNVLSRFTREAHALARIKHKNIVHIYDFQTSGDSVHLVMEWVGGGSLADRLKNKGPFNEREVVAIAIDVGAAFELPAGAAREFAFTRPFSSGGEAPVTVRAGGERRFVLEPFEVLVFEARPLSR